MTLTLKDRFLRNCLALDAGQRARVFQVLLGLETGLTRPHEHSGFGLRKLHPSGIWEVRVGLALRALFLLAKDEAIFLFLGSHDEVKQFVRSL